MKRILTLLFLLSSLGAAAQQQLTVKEFLKLSSKDTTAYLVKGTVSKVRSASSGSFWLQDATGTLLVYGIMDPAAPTRTFTQMDIRKGDTLSVLGRFTVYNGSTLEMKDGKLLRKADGPDHNRSFLESLDRQPSFKGREGKAGAEYFRQWVQARIQPCGETGTVTLRYVVGRKGAVQEVQVVKGHSQALNEEALRVVRSAPKWKPARLDGDPVRVTFFINVEFR